MNKVTTLVVADTTQISAEFIRQPWARKIGVYIPNIDAANVGIEFSIDKGTAHGTTFVPILNISDGDDLLLLASGSDPGFIDFTDFIQSIPTGQDYPLRFTFSAAQNGGPYNLTLFEHE